MRLPLGIILALAGVPLAAPARAAEQVAEGKVRIVAAENF